MRASTVAAPMTFALAALVACRPEPTVAPAPAPPPSAEDAVPDDAFAIAGGVTIPRLAFDEAMAKHSAGGPASRDDRGLRQHVGVALVTRTLLQLELSRLGVTDGAALESRAAPLLAALEREHPLTPPVWWSMPPLSTEDLGGAVVVAADHVVAAEPSEIAAEYEQQIPRWTAEKPWLRLDVWTLRYDDATGVAECDVHIAKYRRCAQEFPVATQPVVLADLSRQASVWRARAEDPEHRELLRTECAAVEAEAMQQTASMGCDWSSDATADERTATATRRRERRAIADAVRGRLAAGEDPASVAAEQGGVVAVRQLFAGEELSKAVLSATRSLGVGKATKPTDDGHAWTVVRLIERHRPGALPMAVVEADIADDLRIRRTAEALEDLPAKLRSKYDVRLHESVESLDAGPNAAPRP